jgi:hypothetical protein
MTAPLSRRAAARVLGGFLVWVGLVGLASILGARPDILLVGLTVGAAAAALWLCVDAVAETDSPGWGQLDDEPVRPPGQDNRFVALTRMVNGHFEARRPDDSLHRQLVGLVDQRLIARYGVSWRADPERAEPLMDPVLVALAEQQPPHPRMTRQQLDVLLSRMEAL